MSLGNFAKPCITKSVKERAWKKKQESRSTVQEPSVFSFCLDRIDELLGPSSLPLIQLFHVFQQEHHWCLGSECCSLSSPQGERRKERRTLRTYTGQWVLKASLFLLASTGGTWSLWHSQRWKGQRNKVTNKRSMVLTQVFKNRSIVSAIFIKKKKKRNRQVLSL